MTREEAIKWLKEHHSIDLNTQDDEALKMAIKSLEAEAPGMISGSTVVLSREAYTDLVDRATKYSDMVDDFEVGVMRCAKCGALIDLSKEHTSFCPVCGQRLRW